MHDDREFFYDYNDNEADAKAEWAKEISGIELEEALDAGFASTAEFKAWKKANPELDPVTRLRRVERNEFEGPF